MITIIAMAILSITGTVCAYNAGVFRERARIYTTLRSVMAGIKPDGSREVDIKLTLIGRIREEMEASR